MRSLLLLGFGAFLAFQFPQGVGPKTSATPPPKLTHEMAEVLSHMRIVDVWEPGMSTPVKVLRIGGVNVQILNENTDSDFPPSGSYVKNGAGNLILGWNVPMSAYSIDRSGSHNLVMGFGNSYASTGGIVSGTYNRALGDDSVVLGGMSNWASNGSVVIGGSDNWASGARAVVGGGYGRSATGDNDWVAGSLLEDF